MVLIYSLCSLTVYYAVAIQHTVFMDFIWFIRMHALLALLEHCGNMSRVWFVERANARKHTCALLSVPSALDSYGGKQQLSLIGMRLPQFSAAQLYLRPPRPGQEIYIDRSLPSSASRKMCPFFFTHLLQKCGTNKGMYYGPLEYYGYIF